MAAPLRWDRVLEGVRTRARRQHPQHVSALTGRKPCSAGKGGWAASSADGPSCGVCHSGRVCARGCGEVRYNANVLRALPVAALLALVLGPGLPSRAHATWSIVAVDTETGEVGVAGATCAVGVARIALLVAGRGVVVVQGQYDRPLLRRGSAALEAGESAAAVLVDMLASDQTPEAARKQLAVVAIGEATEAITGERTEPWAGHVTGSDYVAMGNTLVDAEVVDAAVDVMEETRGQPLAARLLAALEAGDRAGGDDRCASQGFGAISAFLQVARPGDEQPSIGVEATTDSGEALLRLRTRYEETARRPLTSRTPDSDYSDTHSGTDSDTGSDTESDTESDAAAEPAPASDAGAASEPAAHASPDAEAEPTPATCAATWTKTRHDPQPTAALFLVALTTLCARRRRRPRA